MKRTASVAPRVLESTQPFSLLDWVHVSWFYPEGFSPERVVETPSSIFVFGAEQVYKFSNPLSEVADSSEGVEERFRKVIDEIEDSKELAAGLYVGLRAFRWDEDEPVWLHEVPIDAHSIEDLPPGADDVCVVMKRLPSNLMYDALGNANSEPFDALSKVLSRFYGEGCDAGKRFFEKHSDSYIMGLKRRAQIDFDQLQGHGVLSSSGALVLNELRGYVARFLRDSWSLLRERGEAGFFVDRHGDLSAGHICYTKLAGARRRPAVFGRLRRGEMRFGDLLEDLAQLALDFRVRGLDAHEPVLLHSMNRALPGAIELSVFRFFLVLKAVEEALRIVERSHALGLDEDFFLAEKYLGCAFRSVLGVEAPVMVLVGGEENELARTTAQLISAEYLSVAEQMSVNEFCSQVDSSLASGRSVVVERTDLDLREVRLQLFQTSQKRNCPFLVVRSELGKTERQRLALENDPYDVAELLPIETAGHPQQSLYWDEQALGERVRYMVVEPTLRAPEQALAILREVPVRTFC